MGRLSVGYGKVLRRLKFERATGKFGFRSLLPPECLDWNPFSKGNIPVAKANAPLLQLKSFPPPVSNWDEAIKPRLLLNWKFINIKEQ